MKQARSANSTEQRRKLLKGMLSASSVVGLGYSGTAAALASVTQCINNQSFIEPTQFVIADQPPPGSPAWKEVTVHLYTGTGFATPTEGFNLPNNNLVYAAASPWPVIGSPTQIEDGAGYPKKAWVVVYFDSSTHNEIGAFPQYQGPTPVGDAVRAQASLNCLTSLNAGIVGNYTFGG